ncbi:hypothetical protein G5T42_11800 [Microbacterium sp. 4R-513]|uniref:hypothetical protein n=1 Tax=Microbacterium sp. 4R-513 TaxID=2567934 RepID=UPI0013E0EDB8|nr:hypothetical protein [Microbacterium sp. 4R-513]QIG40081.1 hypothetical protein G5T42_11800 [Microbacterium sp. 4R-513]
MSSSDRQRIDRVPGSRRAKLTPAPGTAGEPVEPDASEDAGDEASVRPGQGPNDERMKRDVPPHW